MDRLLLLSFSTLLACNAPSTEGVLVIGHGGLGQGDELPMNSTEALLAGLDLGLDGVEMDVQLTADGVLTAYHPQFLEELTACSGLVNAHTWRELKACPTRDSGHGSDLIRLDSTLLELVQLHPRADLTLDCKLFAANDWWTYLERYTDSLVALANKPAMHGHLVVECQVDDFLRLLHRKAPDLPLFLYATDATEGISRALKLGCTGVTIEYTWITGEQVAAAHAQGLQVALFGTSGNWSHRDALSRRPDRLQTDDPRSIVP